jgi:hypothetical protein
LYTAQRAENNHNGSLAGMLGGHLGPMFKVRREGLEQIGLALVGLGSMD